MTLVIAPETEARLREKARRDGQDVNAVADALLAAALEWDAQERAEAAEGIRRGLEASAAGKVTPLEQVIAEARQKHGFAQSWPFDAGMTNFADPPK